MKLNVLTYEHKANSQSLPAAWPAEVREVADDAPPPAAPWIQMTVAEYHAYRAQHKHLYAAWEASQVAPPDEEPPT
jgi:hypothetical protein